MNHKEKVREKTEMGEIVEIIKDHEGANFWEANLRNKFKTNDRNSQPPKNSKDYSNLMNMEKNKKFTQIGRNHD